MRRVLVYLAVAVWLGLAAAPASACLECKWRDGIGFFMCVFAREGGAYECHTSGNNVCVESGDCSWGTV